MAPAPASSSFRAKPITASTSTLSQPERILTVTGRSTARTMAKTIPAARSGNRSNAEPASALTIFLTGQPMFTSTTRAPSSAVIRAASAISPGSFPKSCIDTAPSAGSVRSWARVFSFPRTSARLLTISAHTSPAPRSRDSTR